MEALKMERQMDNWNDDRLDELSGRMDDGFATVDREMKEGFAKVDQEIKEGFARVDREMKEGFARVDREMKEGFARAATKSELGEVKGDLRRLADKVDRLQLVLIAGFFSLVATLIAGFIVS
jgi:hypothetical protein